MTGIGRLGGLKILCPKGRVGSTPTIPIVEKLSTKLSSKMILNSEQKTWRVRQTGKVAALSMRW